MKPFNVSENIGFDGYSYYCRRCGKAGYAKATQVRGHLSLCPGTLVRKGASPTSTCNHLPTGNGAGLQNLGANYLQVVRGAVDGGSDGGQLQPLVPVVGPANNQLQVDQYQQLDRRITGLENEYQHMLVERNQPVTNPAAGVSGWIQSNLAWVVVLGILVFAVVSMTRNGCQQSSEPASNRKGPDFSKLGERVLNKAADVAISKSLGRAFA
jgi:hypothetical protein